MPRLTGKAQRFDPYKNFRFRVRFSTSATYVAGASKASGFKRATHAAPAHGGGDATDRPGRTEYEAVTIERGVTHDSAFEGWIGKAWTTGSAQVPTDFRRDLVIDVFDEAGRKQLSYRVQRAWVSEFAAQADLDANANALLIERMKIEHEGWELDSRHGPKKSGHHKRTKLKRKKPKRKKATRKKPTRKK